MSTKIYCDRCGKYMEPSRTAILAYEKEGRRYSTLSLSIVITVRGGQEGKADVCDECRTALKDFIQPWLP